MKPNDTNKSNLQTNTILPFMLWVLFFFCFLGGQATENNIPQKYIQIDSLNARSTANWYNDPEQTIQLAEEALTLSRETGYKRGEAEALNNIGVGYYFSSDYDKVLDYYRRTLDTYEEMGDEDGITRAGTLYFRIAKYQKALDSYQAGLNVARKAGDRGRAAQLVANIADVYRNLGDYDAALQWYDNLLYNEELLNDVNGQAVAIDHIAGLHLTRGNLQDAHTWFWKLYTVYKDLGSKPGMASALNQIGSTEHLQGEYMSALGHYKRSLGIQKELGDDLGMITNYLNIGRLFFTLKRLGESGKWTRKGVNLARKTGDREQLSLGLKLLALIEYDCKNFGKAFKAQLEYTSMLEKKSMREKNEQLANTLVLYELGQKKQENEILQARNENYRLTLEKQAFNKWRMLMGFTILLVLVAIGIIYYGYRTKRRDNLRLGEEVDRAVQKQEEQQKIIFHQASLTSLGELAAGIAHEINQPMQNISLSAEAIRSELQEQYPDVAFVKKTADGVFDDIDRVRGIVDHIRIFSSGQKEEVSERFCPEDVVKTALIMVRQQMINHGIQITEKLNAPMGELDGNPHRFEQVILNVLSNARHAVDAKENHHILKSVTVATQIANETFEVVVSDNGIGIDKEKLTDIFLPFFTTKKLGQGTGLGLSIAHGIIHQMGGRIVPQSILGEGTTMSIYLPLK